MSARFSPELRRLNRLLDCVEPRRRAVVIAYELEGMEMLDVASALNIPVNTAWNRLRLAKMELRAAALRLQASKQHAW